jgi:hypothetical protein
MTSETLRMLPSAPTFLLGYPIHMTQACRHLRVEIISQDENGKFLECLDCREIYEAAELDELAAKAREQDSEESSSLTEA